MFDMIATVVRGVAAGTSVGPLGRTTSRTSDGPGGPGGPGGPCTDPLKSLGVSDLSLTSAPVNDRFATFLPVTAFFAMSLRFTWPFLMSPESIRLTPGSATRAGQRGDQRDESNDHCRRWPAREEATHRKTSLL